MNRADLTKKMRTAYVSWGKGRRQPLRFSKYGDPRVEELFSTHYLSLTFPRGLSIESTCRPGYRLGP